MKIGPFFVAMLWAFHWWEISLRGGERARAVACAVVQIHDTYVELGATCPHCRSVETRTPLRVQFGPLVVTYTWSLGADSGR